VILGFALWSLRKFVQGYWFDRSCHSKKDLKGQTAVITGGNSGVGLETAVRLAQHGAKVIIVCRSESRAKNAVAEISNRSNSKLVSYKLADMADPASVRKFAVEYVESGEPLHLLVSNAGIASPSSDGESMWQVNYLSPWLMINLLFPALKETSNKSPCRIVSVSSGSHKRATINWDDPEKSDFQYGQSKLAQIMHMKQLQKQLDKEGLPIIAVSCTPGMTNTNIIEKFFDGSTTMSILYLFLRPLIWCVSRSTWTGSQVIHYCCLSDDIVGGRYYSNCMEKPSMGKEDISNDSNAWARLWDLSEATVNARKE